LLAQAAEIHIALDQRAASLPEQIELAPPIPARVGLIYRKDALAEPRVLFSPSAGSSQIISWLSALGCGASVPSGASRSQLAPGECRRVNFGSHPPPSPPPPLSTTASPGPPHNSPPI